MRALLSLLQIKDAHKMRQNFSYKEMNAIMQQIQQDRHGTNLFFYIFHESFKPWKRWRDIYTIDNVHRKNPHLLFSTSARILIYNYFLWNFINVIHIHVKK